MSNPTRPTEIELYGQQPRKGRQYYQGQYTVINKHKYVGDVNNVVFRSRWELLTFKFIDMDSNVIFWNSEDVKIPYVCRTDNKMHTYYVDLFIQFKSGVKALVEIKPMKDAKPARNTKNRNQMTVLNEQLTYQKNMSKWKAAQDFASDRNMVFMVWTEITLRNMGIKI